MILTKISEKGVRKDGEIINPQKFNKVLMMVIQVIGIPFLKHFLQQNILINLGNIL